MADTRSARADRERERRRAARPPARAAQVDAAARLRQRAALPAEVRRARRPPGRPASASRTSPKFPFTTKPDLRENYPFGMFAVPMEQIVRIHASSGTTGKPTVVGYTQARHRHLGARDGALDPRGGRAVDRQDPRRLRLRPLHRRPRRALRRREPRRVRHPARRRDDRAAGAAHQRLQARHHHGDAVLHAGDRRRVRAPGPRREATRRSASASSAPSRGPRACARRSSGAWGSMRSTSTGCPR